MFAKAVFQLVALFSCAVFLIVMNIWLYNRGAELFNSALSRNLSHPLWSLDGRGTSSISLFSGGGSDGGGGDDEKPRIPALFYVQSEMTVFAVFLKQIRLVEEPLYFSEKQRIAQGHQQSCFVQEKGKKTNVLRLRGGYSSGTESSDQELDSSWDSSSSDERDDPERDVVEDIRYPSRSAHTESKNTKLATHGQQKNNFKRTKFTSSGYANSLVSKNTACCKRNCLVSILTVEEIAECLEVFWHKSEEEQREFILNYLFITQGAGQSGKLSYEYKVNGKRICQNAWKKCYGISNGRFFNLKKEFENGRTTAASFREGRFVRSKRLLKAQTWFEKFVDTMADRMPNENKMHLPSCMTKDRIYKTYVEEVTKNGLDEKPLGYSQFLNMWAKKYKHVIIPKVNRFTKCGVCTLIKEHIHKLRGKVRRLSWIQKKSMHLEQQARERRKYYKHQSKAKRMPDKYLSIITDGMDSSKTNIPHFKVKSKMFSRVSDALKKADATTLDALRQLIARSYTPMPDTIYMDNIYDMKSWIRPYVSTFQQHGTPHVFRFRKNKDGQIEMSYRLLAGGESREWFPEDKPFIIMNEMPPGNPSLLKPENKKNATPGEMGKALSHLNARLTVAEKDWWERFIEDEQKKREVWEEMTVGEYEEAGESFDISSLCSELHEKQREEEDEEVLRAETAILQQLNKEYRPVKQIRGPTAMEKKGKENTDKDPPRKRRKKNKANTDNEQ